MAHQQQLDFVQLAKQCFPDFFSQKKVLEIGSLDICGSVRAFFEDCDYIGIDVADGPGVDIVCQGQEYAGQDGSFDIVLSCEAMEHNPMWKETFLNMIRLARPGGMVLMTCASFGRAEHGTSRTSADASPLSISIGWEYYKNLGPGDFQSITDFDSCFSGYRFWMNWISKDLYLVAFRNNSSSQSAPNPDPGFSKIDAWVRDQNKHLIYSMASAAASLFGERGALLVIDGPFVQSIWKAEATYYNTIGYISRLVKGKTH
jgi:Methyltransferase domain